MKEVVYLGVKLSADGRIGIAASAVGAMQRKVFGSRELSKKVKVEVYVQCNGGANDDIWL